MPEPALRVLEQRIQNLETLLGVNQAANATAPQGFSVRDPSGLQRLRIGALPNGDFGIFLADTIGNSQEILPVTSSYYDGEISPGTGGVTTTSYTAFPNAPTVTAVIGASGDAVVTASSFVTNPSGGTGDIALVIDGGAPSLIVAAGCASTAVAISGASIRRLKGWTSGPGLITPGEHTFTLYYKTSNAAQPIGFSGNYLSVEPL